MGIVFNKDGKSIPCPIHPGDTWVCDNNCAWFISKDAEAGISKEMCAIKMIAIELLKIKKNSGNLGMLLEERLG